MHKPTLNRLAELFDCDAARGSLRWKVSGRGGRGASDLPADADNVVALRRTEKHHG